MKGFRRRRPSRKPFPAHLPRERVVVPPPTCCACCGSEKLSKIGEDVTETLEVIPRRWKVIQTVREKFTCRACEKISQPPAPFHATPRGWAGPNLLAMILFEKYGQHQPLNRQRDRYAREGVDLSLSTLADQVGACTVALKPLHDLISDHVLAAERLHGDDTPVPVLARGRCATGRAWVYVRDDRPFGGADPPASATPRAMANLKKFAGIFHDLLGYNPLKIAGAGHRGTMLEPRAEEARARDIAARKWRKDPPPVSPLALEAVKRSTCCSTSSAGSSARAPNIARRPQGTQRAGAGRAQGWMPASCRSIPRWPRRWITCSGAGSRSPASYGRPDQQCRRKGTLWAGSRGSPADRGGARAAAIYLIGTARLNDVDPQACAMSSAASRTRRDPARRTGTGLQKLSRRVDRIPHGAPPAPRRKSQPTILRGLCRMVTARPARTCARSAALALLATTQICSAPAGTSPSAEAARCLRHPADPS